MIVIPAIDLRGGQCVRLEQGKLEKETIFSRDPVFIAKLWQAQGAKMIHIVDLDGAFSGVSQNTRLIRKIIKAIDIPVEVGGGIRKIRSIKKLLGKNIDQGSGRQAVKRAARHPLREIVSNQVEFLNNGQSLIPKYTQRRNRAAI